MADRLHLEPRHRRVLEALLREHLPGVEVWAYGSRVNGRSHDGSDLDLALRGPGLAEIPIGQLADFEEALQESTIPFLVEACDWASLPKRFHYEIEQEYVILADKNRGLSVADNRQLVGDFSPFSYGKNLPKKTRDSSGDVPVFGANGIIGTHSQMLTSGPTIVIGRKGTVGAIHFSLIPCWPIDTTFYLTDNDLKLLRFKYYSLKTLPLEAMNGDSAVPGLNRDEVHRCLLRVPQEVEQRAIAHILGTLDDKIELNRRMNETLEAMAQAIFKDWFVDFGPVRAKMEGRAPYLPPEIWNQFPDALDNEDKPVGWECRPLDDIAEFLNGLALQKFPASDAEDSLPVIKIAELRRGITPKSNRASRNVPEKYVIKDGDFLFSWSGSLLAKFWVGGDGALNQHLFKVTSNQYPTWFFTQWVHHHLREFQAIAAAKATTMGHIQRGHLRAAKAICPPVGVLANLGQAISPLVERMTKGALESRTLAQTRDTLLPKLISGDIRLGEARKAVEALP